VEDQGTSATPQDSPETEAFVRAQLQRGKARGKIISKLVRAGWDFDHASVAVDRIDRNSRSGQDDSRIKGLAERYVARRHIVLGAAWFLLGIFVTLGTYRLATEGASGSYLVAWGAIGGGLAEMIYGIRAYWSAK